MPEPPRRKNKTFSLWKIPKEKKGKKYARPILFWDGERIGIERRRIQRKAGGKLEKKQLIEENTAKIHVRKAIRERGNLNKKTKNSLKRKRLRSKPDENIMKSIDTVNSLLKELKKNHPKQEKQMLKEELTKQLKFLKAPEKTISKPKKIYRS